MALVNSVVSTSLKTPDGGVVFREHIKRQKSKPIDRNRVHDYYRSSCYFPMTEHSGTYRTYGLSNWVHGYATEPSTKGAGAQAYNKAYAKLVDLLGPKAEWGVSLAEFNKTRDMVTSRLLQLLKGVNALRRGRFGDFIDAFDIKPKPRDRGRRYNKPSKAGELWLEYWMGWAPTVGDVYAGMKVLTSELPPVRVKARGVAHEQLSYLNTAYRGRREAKTLLRHGVQLIASVRLVNPNLYLLNQLGLANPALIIHDLTPWSWMAGWFQNLRDVIASWTDFLGLEISDRVMTRRVKWAGTVNYFDWNTSNGGYVSGRWIAEPHGLTMRRTRLAFPFEGPAFQLKPVKALSLTRGLTLSSLLVTRLNQIAPKKGL